MTFPDSCESAIRATRLAAARYASPIASVMYRRSLGAAAKGSLRFDAERDSGILKYSKLRLHRTLAIRAVTGVRGGNGHTNDRCRDVFVERNSGWNMKTHNRGYQSVDLVSGDRPHFDLTTVERVRVRRNVRNRAIQTSVNILNKLVGRLNQQTDGGGCVRPI